VFPFSSGALAKLGSRVSNALRSHHGKACLTLAPSWAIPDRLKLPSTIAWSARELRRGRYYATLVNKIELGMKIQQAIEALRGRHEAASVTVPARGVVDFYTGVLNVGADLQVDAYACAS